MKKKAEKFFEMEFNEVDPLAFWYGLGSVFGLVLMSWILVIGLFVVL